MNMTLGVHCYRAIQSLKAVQEFRLIDGWTDGWQDGWKIGKQNQSSLLQL